MWDANNDRKKFQKIWKCVLYLIASSSFIFLPAFVIDAQTSAGPIAKKRLIITVDVEAQPPHAPNNHVDRLIWGKFGNKELGIRQMIEIADRYHRKLTFFLDYCEQELYPGEIERIVQYIKAHGHDLQLHAHPEFLSDKFWEKRGLKPPKTGLENYTEKYATVLMDYLFDTAVNLGGQKPIAFRGGGFRYDDELLKAMSRRGLRLSFNYNTTKTHQINNENNLNVFRWNNGVYEVPMGTLDFNGGLKQFDFVDKKLAPTFIKQYYRQFGSNAVLVMILHSWSFLYLNEKTDYFEYRDDKLKASFEGFLASLPKDVEVITASGLNQLIKQNEVKMGPVRDIGLVDKKHYHPNSATAKKEIDFGQNIRALVRNSVPPNATVLVISYGDDSLLKFDGRKGEHFPQGPDGVYAGFYPANSQEAISHLEGLKAKGANYLLIPSPALWWLDYYKGFAEHLRTHGRIVAYQEDTGLLFSLQNNSSAKDVLGGVYAARPKLKRPKTRRV